MCPPDTCGKTMLQLDQNSVENCVTFKECEMLTLLDLCQKTPSVFV